MRTWHRVVLAIVGTCLVVLAIPAFNSGLDTTTRTGTRSYIVTEAGSGPTSDYYCTEDTILDGGAQCNAFSVTLPTTSAERWKLAIARGLAVVVIGVVCIFFALRRRKHATA